MALVLTWTPALAADALKAKDDVVTVRGCLQGLVLTTLDDGTNAVEHRQYTLRGDRATVQQLKTLSSHVVEVTGVLKGGDDRAGLRTAEKRIPKGRIFAGVGGTPLAAPNQPQDPAPTATLDVKTFADINSCS
jgi:hypothetical protein